MNTPAHLPAPVQIGSPVPSNWLSPKTIEQGLALAEMMAKAKLVPEHLRGSPADCLLVLSQAARWGLDPFAVAQATAVVRGKLCFEGKLVAAVLSATGAIEGRLNYDISGEGRNMKIVITGTPRGGSLCTTTGTVADWATENAHWQKDPRSMLVYRGTRQWARQWAPEAMLGIQTPDEVEEVREVVGTVVAETKAAKIREVAAVANVDGTDAEPVVIEDEILTVTYAQTPDGLKLYVDYLCTKLGKESVSATAKALCGEFGVSTVRGLGVAQIPAFMARLESAVKDSLAAANAKAADELDQ